MIAEMLDKVLKLMPEGQRIVGIIEIRPHAIIVTDQFVYKVSPAEQPFGFTVHRLCPIL